MLSGIKHSFITGYHRHTLNPYRSNIMICFRFSWYEAKCFQGSMAKTMDIANLEVH